MKEKMYWGMILVAFLVSTRVTGVETVFLFGNVNGPAAVAFENFATNGAGDSSGSYATNGVTITATTGGTAGGDVFNATATGFGINAYQSGDDADRFDAVNGMEFMTFSFNTDGNLKAIDCSSLTYGADTNCEYVRISLDNGPTTNLTDGVNGLGYGVLSNSDSYVFNDLAFTNGQRLTLQYGQHGSGNGWSLDSLTVETSAMVTDQPPVFIAMADHAIKVNSNIVFEISALDTVDNDVITLIATNLPGGATFSSATNTASVSSMFVWSNAAPAGYYTVTFVAMDENGAATQEVGIAIYPDMVTTSPIVARINEIRMEDFGPDDINFVEIIARAGMDMTGCKLELRWSDPVFDGPVWTVILPSCIVPDDRILDVEHHKVGFVVLAQSFVVPNTDFLMPDINAGGWEGLFLYDSEGYLLDAVAIGDVGDFTVDDPGTVVRFGDSRNNNFIHLIMEDSFTNTCLQGPNNIVGDSGAGWTIEEATPGVLNHKQNSGMIVLTGGAFMTRWPPVLLHPGNQAVVVSNTLTFPLIADDPVDGDPLTYEGTNLPGSSEIDPDTGIFTWVNASPEGIYTSRFYVVDQDGASMTQVVLIAIYDTATAMRVVLNEIACDPVGNDDNREYIEIAGPPYLSLNDTTLLEINGNGSQAGVIELAMDLSDYILGTNGLLVVGDDYPILTPYGVLPLTSKADLRNHRLENGSVTYMLVKGFSGARGQDLDSDNDGIFNDTPWTTVLDSVCWLDGDLNDRMYSLALLYQAGDTPDAVTRVITNQTPQAEPAWYYSRLRTNLIDTTGITYIQSAASPNIPYGAQLTPGNTNFWHPLGPDSDEDGLPNYWENQYFGNSTSALVSVDTDSDQWSNWEEYIMDSNPTNQLSYYPAIITNIEVSVSNVWRVQAGPPTTNSRKYAVWYTTNLNEGAWRLYCEPVWGVPDGSALIFTVTNDVKQRSYRTSVILP